MGGPAPFCGGACHQPGPDRRDSGDERQADENETRADVAHEHDMGDEGDGNTVKTLVSRVLTKLSARDRAQLVVVAYETGLVRPGEHPDC